MNRLLKGWFIIILCAPVTALFANEPINTATPEIIRYQEDVLKAINQYRVSKRLKPLKANSVITEQARLHSIDMAQKKLPFGHDAFNQRIDVIYKALPGSEAGAENIAYFKISPQALVNKWLTSPEHKKNIQGNYNLTGIGVAKDSKGWLYTTQIFIKNNKTG